MSRSGRTGSSSGNPDLLVRPLLGRDRCSFTLHLDRHRLAAPVGHLGKTYAQQAVLQRGLGLPRIDRDAELDHAAKGPEAALGEWNSALSRELGALLLAAG